MGLKIGDAGYRIIGPIASGGMGEVYKAEHVITKRIEAIKLLCGAGTEEEAERFLREIQLQASLSHPNIAAVYNAFSMDDDLVMVMELVEGEPLGAVLTRGRLPMRRALHYACQALDAIAYAHAHGVIHRDISPANIIITDQDGVKLMDFGLAKAASSPSLSQSGASMGSPYYMSPEQVMDSTRASAASDIYSLGAVLYEMVTGRKVFQGESAFAIMQAQVEKIPVPPIEVDSSIPRALNAAVLTALNKDPARRFPSADAFRLALESVTQEAARPAQARTLKRGRPVAVLQFAVTAAAIVTAAYFAGFRRPPAEMKIPLPAIEIRPPAPPPFALRPSPPVPEAVQPAVESPPPQSTRRRQPRLPIAAKRNLTPVVVGEQPPTRPAIEPVRRFELPAAPPRAVELRTTPPAEKASAETSVPSESEPSASVTTAPVTDPKDKKPRHRVWRALGKILGPLR